MAKKTETPIDPMAGDVREHQRRVTEFKAHLQDFALRLIGAGASATAGRLLVLDRLVTMHDAEASATMLAERRGEGLLPAVHAALAEDAAATAAAPGRVRPEHRHKFGPDKRCTVAGCGKVKGTREGAPPPPLDPVARTVPLDLARAADRYAGGGFGSSGTGDR